MPNARLTVATVGDVRPIGFCACRHGHLDHLYVAPASQRCGAGTLLLADAMDRNPDGLRLHVFQRNIKARTFYERNGFRLVELRDGSQKEEKEPDAVYDWCP